MKIKPVDIYDVIEDIIQLNPGIDALTLKDKLYDLENIPHDRNTITRWIAELNKKRGNPIDISSSSGRHLYFYDGNRSKETSENNLKKYQQQLADKCLPPKKSNLPILPPQSDVCAIETPKKNELSTHISSEEGGNKSKDMDEKPETEVISTNEFFKGFFDNLNKYNSTRKSMDPSTGRIYAEFLQTSYEIAGKNKGNINKRKFDELTAELNYQMQKKPR